MATVTKGKTFISGDLVTPAALHQLVDSATVTNIANADISASAAIADTKLATISTAGKVSNSATTATELATPNAIVTRNSSGNFAAGTIFANLSGNATNVTGMVAVANGGTGATTAANARTNLGLGNSATLNTGTLAGTVATGDHTHGAATATVTGFMPAADKSKLDAATNANTVSTLVRRDASGNFSAGTITANLSGNATNVSGTVAVANGGTGATTAANARTNLGLGNSATLNTGTLAGTVATGDHTHAQLHNQSHAITSADHTAGNWKVFHSNGIGQIQEISIGSAGQVLTANGPAVAPSWQTLAATSSNANNLSGGVAGAIPYQSAVNTTAMLSPGTTGQVLRSNGAAAAPSWDNFGTSGNTANTVVARDGSGNFSAGTITANLSGNATNVTGMVAVANGGTGATTAANARTNLGLGNSATLNTGTLAGTVATGDHTHGAATATVTGFMPAADKSKLDAATNVNTVSTLVRRDASGNFSAGTITANLSGNATNVSGTVAVANGGTGATTAANARTNLGLGSAATLFTGITAGTVATGDHTHGAATATVTGFMSASDKSKLDAATSSLTASSIVQRDVSGNFSAGTITANLSGNATTASTLATGRTISLTGDVTGTAASFNGSANVSAATTIANSAVTTAKIAANAVTTAKIAAGSAGQVLLSNGAASPVWGSVMEPKAFIMVKFTNDSGTFTVLRSQGVTMTRTTTGIYNFAFSTAFSQIPLISSAGGGREWQVWTDVTTTSATLRLLAVSFVNSNLATDDPVDNYGQPIYSFLFF